jgi:hypothetical protein
MCGQSFHSILNLKVVEYAEENWNRAAERTFDICEKFVIGWVGTQES